MTIDKITSQAGKFSVISQLLLKKYDVRIIVGRKRHINIFVFIPDSEKMYKLDVKTTYGFETNSKDFGKTLGWTVGSTEETREEENLLYCFVHMSEKSEDLRYFIVPKHIVQKYLKESHSYWLNSKEGRKDNTIRKFRLGFKDQDYAISTPLTEDYENQWSYLK